MKRFVLSIFVLVLLISGVSAGSVSRVFTSSGDELIVSLNVDVGSEGFYVIEEIIPSGWELVDSGDLDSSVAGRLTFVVLSDAQDTNYDYVVKTSNAGEYEFYGSYTLGSAIVKGVAGTNKASNAANTDETASPIPTPIRLPRTLSIPNLLTITNAVPAHKKV